LRSRTVIVVVALALIGFAALWLLRANLPGTDRAGSGDVAQIPSRSVYPGGSFDIPFDYRKGYAGVAERGVVQVSRDDTALVYVAPFDGESDAYRVVDTRSDQTLAEGAVTLSAAASASLEVLEREANRRVVAQYGDVQVEALLEGDVATASYRHEASDTTLQIRLQGQEASMTWGAVTLDGYGPLTRTEAEAMQAITTGPLAAALTMVPLDIGCVENPFDVPAEIYAALLFPWQMTLKYAIARREQAVRHYMSASRCAFPGYMEPDMEKPQNIAVLWDADHSVPSVYEAFPFDGQGAMPALRQ
jgi:hypothetical protein